MQKPSYFIFVWNSHRKRQKNKYESTYFNTFESGQMPPCATPVDAHFYWFSFISVMINLKILMKKLTLLRYNKG